jgi:hypothetical protein
MCCRAASGARPYWPESPRPWIRVNAAGMSAAGFFKSPSAPPAVPATSRALAAAADSGAGILLHANGSLTSAAR